MALNLDKWVNGAAGDFMADQAVRDQDIRLKSIDVNDIEEHPMNRTVREDKVDAIKESIRRDGLGQQPLVRLNPDRDSAYRYQHIAGWHRILAFRALYDETGERKYAKIPCIVVDGCSDERAENLMVATNYFTAELTREERGAAAQRFIEIAQKLRGEDPDAYRGQRTEDIAAGLLAETAGSGESVSGRTISRDAKAYRESKIPPATGEDAPKPEAEEAESAFGSLDRALARVEKLSQQGITLNDDTLRSYERRIRAVRSYQQQLVYSPSAMEVG